MNANRHNTDDRFDAKLDSLLDDALGATSVPGGVPADLTEKILAVTVPKLQQADEPRGVLARIGHWPAWRIAAAIVIVSSAAALWVVTTTDRRSADWTQQVNTQLAQISASESRSADAIDQQLALLDADLELLANVDDQWSSDLASFGNIDDPWSAMNGTTLF